MLMPGWDLQSTFVIDQIRRQEDPLLKTEFEMDDVLKGSGFDPKSKTLAIWSLAPATQKPLVMTIREEKRADRMIWNLQNTSDTEIAQLMTQVSFMNLAKVDDLSKRYETTFGQMMALAKKHEEVVVKNHSLEEQIAKLKEELEESKREKTPIIEEATNVVIDVAGGTREGSAMAEIQSRDTSQAQGMNATSIMLLILQHRINVLKNKVGVVHALYGSLQEATKIASEAMSFLEPTFKLWSSKERVLDKLKTAILYSDDFPDKVSDTIDMVSQLNDTFAFFNGKSDLMSGKLQLFGDQCPPLIPKIYNETGELKAQPEWESEFDAILDSQEIKQRLEQDTNAEYCNELIDGFCKVERDMAKFVSEARTATDARWTEAVAKLEEEKAFDWPTVKEVNRWEAKLKG
jgi:regulator of replication initiation timing